MAIKYDRYVVSLYLAFPAANMVSILAHATECAFLVTERWGDPRNFLAMNMTTFPLCEGWQLSTQDKAEERKEAGQTRPPDSPPDDTL